MSFTSLTEEYLPFFVYLIDMLEQEEEDFLEPTKIIHKLEESYGNEFIPSWSTLNRAIKLRKELKLDNPSGKAMYIPKKNTLDALMAYKYGSGYVFQYLVSNTHDVDAPKAVVESYYSKNKPSTAVIDAIFYTKEYSTNHKKINGIANAKAFLNESLDSSNEEILQIVHNKLGENKTESLLKKCDEVYLTGIIKKTLRKELSKMEKKLLKAIKLQSNYGSLGLIFFSVPSIESLEESIFEDVIMYIELNNDFPELPDGDEEDEDTI